MSTEAEKISAMTAAMMSVKKKFLDAQTEIGFLENEKEKLIEVNARYKAALKKIAGEDFRGNRPNSAVIAYEALNPKKVNNERSS